MSLTSLSLFNSLRTVLELTPNSFSSPRKYTVLVGLTNSLVRSFARILPWRKVSIIGWFLVSGSWFQVPGFWSIVSGFDYYRFTKPRSKHDKLETRSLKLRAVLAWLRPFSYRLLHLTDTNLSNKNTHSLVFFAKLE